MSKTFFLPKKKVMLVMGVFLSHAVFSQCEFTITYNNTDDQCLYAVEEVVWQNADDVTITGNSVAKSSAITNWDAGALSVNTVKNNGWATTTIEELNKDRIFGLSPSSVSTTPGFGRGKYTIYFASSGTFAIYESGNHKISPAGQYSDNTYRNGDIFKIRVDKGIVKYYQNNTLLYTSAVFYTAPLVVNADLNSPASTLKHVEVANGSDGTFKTIVSSGGPQASYQWYLDGTAIPGATSSTYTNTSLNSPDVLTCVLTFGAAGCGAMGSTMTSNAIRFQTQAATSFGNYYVVNTAASIACLEARDQAVFTDLVNTEANGNTITKILGNSGTADAGAFSINGVADNGSAEMTVTSSSGGGWFGLSSSNAGVGTTSIQYAFQIRGDGTVDIYECNALRTTTSTKKSNVSSPTGAVLKIGVVNGKVKYYVNDVMVYESLTVPTLPLYVDLTLNTLNSTVNNVVITNGSTGSFTAMGSPLGSSPTYQWIVDPMNTGVTTSSYTNASLSNGDQVKCEINPGLTGCSAVTASASVLSDRTYAGTFYINNASSAIACAETIEEVAWTNMVGVTASSNNVTKVLTSDGQWDAGATSLNKIYNNGYAETVTRRTTTNYMFGISSEGAAGNVNNSSIQFGFNFFSNSTYLIYESGITNGTYRGYNDNDVFRIKIENNQIKYYKNATLIQTSGVAPSIISAAIPYVVDVSLNSLIPAAQVNDVIVSNGTTGLFQTNVTGAGPSPTYEWFVNSGSVATTSTYINNLLTAGDEVVCEFNPNIAGCTTPLTSNKITVRLAAGAGSPSTTWTGSTSTAWDAGSNWSNGVPLGYTKVTIPNGMPRYPTISADAGAYDITIESSASLSIAGSNSLTLFNEWHNSGSFTPNTSTVTLKACTNNRNVLSSTASEAFNNVTITNANGVDVSGEHHIKGLATLSSGIVRYSASSDIIVFDDNATVTGASDNSHINGKVKKIGNDAFVFPIGKNGLYRKLSISAPANITDEFTSEYFNSDAKILSVYGTSVHSSFWTVSGCEHWTLERSGASDVAVELSWNLASGCLNPPYITNRNDLRVTYWNGSLWDDAGNGGTSGDNNNGTITSSNLITDYTAFTLASLTSDNPLPIELADFKAKETSAGIALDWITLSENNSHRFVIQRSDANLNFSNIDSISASGESKAKIHYGYLDRKPFKGKNYYRLKLIDYDGSHKYSDLVFITSTLETTFRLYPNPVKQGDKVYSSMPNEKGKIINLVNKEILNIPGNTEFVDTDGLLPGVYLYCGQDGLFQRLIITGN